MRRRIVLAAAIAILGSCAAAENAAAPTAPAEQSALLRSTPAAGARVAAPRDLLLVFRRPVRLAEVIVAGSDGMTIPMMIHSAGEQTEYSLPLPDLARGVYEVRWRAIAPGSVSHQGSFSFTVAG